MLVYIYDPEFRAGRGVSVSFTITSSYPTFPSCLLSVDRVNRTPSINSHPALHLQYPLKKFL